MLKTRFYIPEELQKLLSIRITRLPTVFWQSCGRTTKMSLSCHIDLSFKDTWTQKIKHSVGEEVIKPTVITDYNNGRFEVDWINQRLSSFTIMCPNVSYSKSLSTMG